MMLFHFFCMNSLYQSKIDLYEREYSIVRNNEIRQKNTGNFVYNGASSVSNGCRLFFHLSSEHVFSMHNSIFWVVDSADSKNR